MNANAEEMELRERLDLMQRMIAEGRRSTQHWAWSFLLWGLAYYIAIAWSVFGKTWAAWPVTMIAAAIINSVLAVRIKRREPGRTIGRALGAVWSVMGTALFITLMALGVSGRAEIHIVVAIVGAMLAVANGISGLIIRWKMQLACAVVWLATAVAACFASDMPLAILSLAAIFFCQIVFGVYGMILESRGQKRGVIHA